MSLTELADKWDAKAAELMQTSKAYRTRCNEARKNGYVGRAAGLMAAAQELREALASADTAE
jgi:hypothetical protein